MKKNILTRVLIILSALVPSLSFAAAEGLKGLLSTDIPIIFNSLIKVLFGVALIYFFWGIIQFISKDAGNEKTREDGKKKIMWGIIALFVFIAYFGIIQAIGNLIGITVPNQNGTLNSRTTVPTSSTLPSGGSGL